MLNFKPNGDRVSTFRMCSAGGLEAASVQVVYFSILGTTKVCGRVGYSEREGV